MVWKTGKFGVNNGRTIRSTRLGRVRGKRSEGLLVQTTAFSGGNPEEGEFEVITFSLGKQNRWLLPEVIKENSVEEIEKEEVVLVERYTNEGKVDRPDCFSVYNSKNSTTRKSKRKFARAKDLLSDVEEMKTQYEVTYPFPSGSWQNEKQRKRQTSHLGSRKKSSFVNWNIEDDFDEDCERDPYCHDIEEDFSGQSYSSNIDRTVTLDLGLLLKNSSKKKKKHSEKIKTETAESKELTSSKGDCIYVKSGDDMYNAHQELLAQIQETSFDYKDGSYDSEDWAGDDFWRSRGRGGFRGGRGRGRGRGRRGVRHYIQDETLPSDPNLSLQSATGSSRPDTQHHTPDHDQLLPTDLSSKCLELSEDSCEQCVSLVLTRSETSPASLKEKWGEMYKEAASLPRSFILNATPESSQYNGEIFTLFQLDCLTHDANNVNVQASTVVVCDEEGMHESVLAEFISKIKASSAEGDVFSLKEVVNIAKSCFCPNTDNKADLSEPRQPKLSLDVFAELFRWNSKALSLKRALQEIRKSLAKKEKGPSENAHVVGTGDDCQHECGICFMELQYNDSSLTSCHTSLTSCGHKFCKSCWRAHLKTQIEHGHTDLQCPGYECNSAVDDVTLMSLVPSLYGRHLTKRLETSLEMDPEWKWCPADKCNLVVKATRPQDSSVAHKSSVPPFPVVCVCGTMWCFKCQEDAHWPATCEKALVFRQKNERYAKMVENSQNVALIMSVDVKNCPFCHYPIEKGPGCNHMHCGLCNQEFCWWCLQKWDYDHVCKEKVMQRQVELPVNTKHLRSYEHFAVTSRMARSTTQINKVNKDLDKLENTLQIYRTFLPKLKQDKPWRSCAERRLNSLAENITAQILQEAFSFKFQALLALEGLAIVLSFMKDSPNKRLAWEFERLFFITERLNEILQDLNTCVHQETVERLKHFIACGKECLFVIYRNTK
ncbi:hypothetical protein ACROYT_G042432 [Oculina patagonica]